MIKGGFKNMNSDQIIKCILSVLLKIEKSLENKLDRGGYQGTGKILDDRITALENPDTVLKYSDNTTETLLGLNLSLLADAYEWRINQIVTDNASAYNTTLTSASDGFYKFALLQGNVNGTYSIKYSAETAGIGSIPAADINNIALRAYLIFGNIVDNPISTGPEQLDFKMDGINNFINIGTTREVVSVYLETQIQEKIWWSQSGNIVNFSFTNIQPLDTLITIIIK